MKRHFVAVTGGAGFIGSHLSEALLAQGKEVTIIDNFSIGRMENVPKGALLKKLDIVLAKPKKIEKAIDGCSELWHFAADKSVRDFGTRSLRANILGTQNVLEACARLGSVDTVHFASSSTVYGNGAKNAPKEKSGPLAPISAYGVSKVAGEALLSAYCEAFGLSGISYRLANVVGKRQTGGLIPDLLLQRKNGRKSLRVLGDGSQEKSYIHISDCISGLLFAAKVGRPKKGKSQQYNIASKDALSVRDISFLVAKAAGFTQINYLGGSTWAGDVPKMRLDTSKMVRLGWTCRLSSRAAVEKAIEELS